MKREVAKYVSECDICRRVKASHLRSAGMLQPLDMPSWKWEDISMDMGILITESQRSNMRWNMDYIIYVDSTLICA